MPDEPDVPDIYCDSVQIAMTPYDVLLLLGKNKPDTESKGAITVSSASVGLVRMSLEHAKVLAILLKRDLQDYEQKTGTVIPLDPDMAAGLGIGQNEDW